MIGPSAAARGQAIELPRSAAGHRNPWLIAVVVSIATFMTVLDTSIANVALRHIAGSLAAGVDESTWIITSYLIATAVVLPISGWLSRVVGRKRFYMLCVGLFTLSSVLCALAPSLDMLIAFRVLQGLGGGGMAPSEQTILADTFPQNKRAQAFALYGVAVIVAPTVGPALGGWITDNWSWHWIFLINAPIGLLSLALVAWLVTEPETLKRERRHLLARGLSVDWGGLVLIALALGCLEVVLDKGQRDDWFASNFIITFASISALSFALFFPWELARKDPIVEVRLLFQRQFGTCFLMMMVVGGILFSSIQLLPQLEQTDFDYTATLAGLSLMAGGFAMLLLMPVVARLSDYVQPKYLIALGMLVVAMSMWGSTSLTPYVGFSYFVWMRITQTVGLPFLFIPITSASYADVPPDKTNQASALINVARYLGGSIGISMATTLLARREQFHQLRLTEHLYQSSLPYQEALRRGAADLVAKGTAVADARHQAIGLIEQMVHAQASLLSYIDVFFAFAVVAFCMVFVALLLLRPIPLSVGQRRTPVRDLPKQRAHQPRQMASSRESKADLQRSDKSGPLTAQQLTCR
jgi:DHA2 family multidrug resistance protein